MTYAGATPADDLTLPVTAFFPAAPTPVAPAGTGIPLSPPFTWTAPSPAPAAYSYDISVSGVGIGWFHGPMPSNQLSVPFATLSGGPMLNPGTADTWLIEAVDANGNSASAQTSFTTQ